MAAGAWPGYQSSQVFPVSADLSPYRRCLASRGTRNVLGPQKQTSVRKNMQGTWVVSSAMLLEVSPQVFVFVSENFISDHLCLWNFFRLKMWRFCYQNQVTLARVFFFKAEKKANYAAPPFSIMEEIQNVGLLLCLVSFKTSLVNLSLFCWHHKSLVQSKHTKQEQNDLSNRGCVFGGICCFSSVLLITTDTECETMCCQTLGSINIIPAHWAGIQPISGPKPGEFFFKRTTQSKDSSGDCFYLATNMLSNY